MTDELEAMGAINDAMAGLEEETQARVMRWAVDKFVGQGGAAAAHTGPMIQDGNENGDQEFAEIGDLMHATGASTGPTRALVAGYWFQVVEGRQGWGGADVNGELKNLGHALANVTKTLDSLMKRKPALVIQTAKGRSRSARKTYKLTTEGVRVVRNMLANSGGGEDI
jgi:hypothetical protein